MRFLGDESRSKSRVLESGLISKMAYKEKNSMDKSIKNVYNITQPNVIRTKNKTISYVLTNSLSFIQSVILAPHF